MLHTRTTDVDETTNVRQSRDGSGRRGECNRDCRSQHPGESVWGPPEDGAHRVRLESGPALLTVLEPDDEIATIDLWERHNPLVPFNNVFDAEQQVDSHDDYDSIDGGGTSVRDEWEASVGDLTVF